MIAPVREAMNSSLAENKKNKVSWYRAELSLMNLPNEFTHSAYSFVVS